MKMGGATTVEGERLNVADELDQLYRLRLEKIHERATTTVTYVGHPHSLPLAVTTIF